MRRVMRAIGLCLLGAAFVAGPAVAAQPGREFVAVDDVFVDDFLSDACGVEVTAHVTGHVIFRLFADPDGNPVRELNNYALHVLWSSENGEINAQDVGADRVTYLDNGGVILIVIGTVQSFSIPGQGRVYADVGRTMLTFDAAGNLTSVTPLGGVHDEDQPDASAASSADRSHEW